MSFNLSTSVFSLSYEARKSHEQYVTVSKLWEFTVLWNLQFHAVQCMPACKTEYDDDERNLSTYISALYIVFLFVKAENNNFIKEIKQLCCLCL